MDLVDGPEISDSALFLGDLRTSKMSLGRDIPEGPVLDGSNGFDDSLATGRKRPLCRRPAGLAAIGLLEVVVRLGLAVLVLNE